MKNFDYIGIGFCSNDHLAVLPFIPMDTKVRMLSHAIMGGGPAVLHPVDQSYTVLINVA